MLTHYTSSKNDFAPLQSIDRHWAKKTAVDLSILRLDNIHPKLSGNKYFKLMPNIELALKHNFSKILSFGGCYSNHIHALALAGEHYGIQTIGLIRGEKILPLNPTLSDAESAGMTLRFLSRTEYRRRHDPLYLDELQREFPDCFIVPEGGSNVLGVKGCMAIAEQIKYHLGNDFDYVVLPVGSGGTLAGVSAALPDKKIVGISVLKDNGYLADEVNNFHRELGCNHLDNWEIVNKYHFGGYAKRTPVLENYVEGFYSNTGVRIEPVYSGKMFFAIEDLINSGEIEQGSKVVAIHTGGLQGYRESIDTAGAISTHQDVALC